MCVSVHLIVSVNNVNRFPDQPRINPGSTHMCPYLCICGEYHLISVSIRPISVHICLYLYISVHISLYPNTCINICTYVCICLYHEYLLIFVNICPYISAYICQYAYICLYVCICAHCSDQAVKAATDANSLAVTAVTAACLYLSISSISLHICLYQTYIRTYMHIFVHICKYSSYLARDQSPEQISPELISGTRQIIIVVHMC